MTDVARVVVVGGVYRENCLAPARRELYGSGGRAAAIIRELGGTAELRTYLDTRTQEDFSSIAAAHGYDVVSEPRDSAITFGYAHPLARPEILPSRHCISVQPPLVVDAANVLRFGMVEGDAVVHADQAVYDPQDLDKPIGFRANGSEAKRLAVVLNGSEARLIIATSVNGPTENVAREVAESQSADVVVIKEGAAGALVWDCGVMTRIPAYRTARVWKIGSGDTFSGAFAHYWMAAGYSAVDAARRASLAAAHYCDGGNVSNAASQTTLEEVVLRQRQPGDRRLVYLAGPFFTTAELWLVAEAWRFFRNSRVPIFSPYHNIGRGSPKQVAPKDIEAIQRSSVVLALVDGCDPGTLFEVGYARALGIPVVALAENPKKEDLTMLEGSDCEIYEDFAAALYRVSALV